METTTLAKTVQKINDFYKTNGALIFFMSTTTIFALLQVILYSLNLMQVNGATIVEAGELHHLWSSWILLGASIVGCYAGFIGGIMLFRGSLSFVYWQNLATILSTLTQALASMWFGALVSIYFIIMNSIRYYVWKNNLLEKWNWSVEKIVTIGIIIFVILMVVLNSIALTFGETLYSTSKWMETKNYAFDATGASFNITASFLILFKNRWAFLFYGIAKIFTIWNYADAGLIVPIVQMALFWIMDITGFIGWSIHAIKPKETAVELDFE